MLPLFSRSLPLLLPLLLLFHLPTAYSQALTLASCNNTSFCKGDRECVALFEPANFVLCPPDKVENCFCFPIAPKLGSCVPLDSAEPKPDNDTDPDCFFACTTEEKCPKDEACKLAKGGVGGGGSCLSTTCEKEKNCDDGEVCAILPFDNTSSAACIDKEVVKQQGIKRAGVCVDVDMLGEFEEHQLVFGRHHKKAWVLCDNMGSCATPGHVVSWKGRAMMMKSYCAGRCQWKVKMVNSPKYQKGLRVGGKTQGLEFTAFAARYETSVEESVLRGLVRIGL